MTTQAAMIMDTILGMKRTIAQEHDSSDSDDPFLRPSNRGSKLKRKARHLPNQLPKSKKGRTSYTRTIEYAGYKRDILRRNQKRYDDDGDELDSEDEDEAADARAAEGNPYADVKLEKLLCPLTSAAQLPEHPSLSVPYLSSALSDMAQQACENVQHERKILENAKLLLVRLRGDETWIPTEQANAADDEQIFGTAYIYDKIVAVSSANGTNGTIAPMIVNGDVADELSARTPSGGKDKARINGATREHSVSRENGSTTGVAGDANSKGAYIASKLQDSDQKFRDDSGFVNGRSTPSRRATGRRELDRDHDASNDDPPGKKAPQPGKEADPKNSEPEKDPEPERDASENDAAQSKHSRPETTKQLDAEDDEDAKDSVPEVTITNGHEQEDERMGEGKDDTRLAPKGMRTRAQAQAASEPAASSRDLSVAPPTLPPRIHPLFLLPATAKPDPDYGLSAPEAEETRRMLMIFVQKQEEICRGAEQLYEGLLKANRQRLTVLKWCKAEAHVGEMSDGEDWYDKEEWGLEDDLRKGEADDRVADDDVGVQAKKTRGRRA